MTQMIIRTKELNQWNQDGFDLNEKAERRICEMVFKSPVRELSEGNDPRWDVVLEDGTTIEVKFTDKYDIFIETSYSSGAPSGLLLSQADYYLIVHKGYWNGDIGKVKVIPRWKLMELFESNVCETKEYQGSRVSPGAKGFVIKRELGYDDGWCGNLNYDGGFDLSGWAAGKRVNRL